MLSSWTIQLSFSSQRYVSSLMSKLKLFKQLNKSKGYVHPWKYHCRYLCCSPHSWILHCKAHLAVIGGPKPHSIASEYFETLIKMTLTINCTPRNGKRHSAENLGIKLGGRPLLRLNSVYVLDLLRLKVILLYLIKKPETAFSICTPPTIWKQCMESKTEFFLKSDSRIYLIQVHLNRNRCF